MLHKTRGATHGSFEGPLYGKVSSNAKAAKKRVTNRLRGARSVRIRLATAFPDPCVLGAGD
ncbi:hypothetical protein J2X98_000466 [Pseudarthrobacter enclensis]|uniref:Uncharacterized protein n=1 Tax=Pseudarthrobacter enclensis TaxID=993070 RepID=A0ABT9RNS7_9MICC|nr:hypothetical protein [Pseudarthrobacter enclensis]